MAKYILAVSGGIDSMVMLDLIARDYRHFRHDHFAEAAWPEDFMVAHFDHGIRGKESHDDAEFVLEVANQKYGLATRIGWGDLPSNASEDMARSKRYDFLYRVASEFSDSNEKSIIVTAHHRDDLLETVVMNIVRGTGWRGLAPMSQPDVMRPLLSWSKSDIVKYALQNNLTWREDETNYSPKYFRNRLRGTLATFPESAKGQLLDMALRQIKLRQQIDNEIVKYIKEHVQDSNGGVCLRRYDLIMVPCDVGIEILRYVTNGRLTIPQLRSLLLFIRVGQPHKRMKWKDVSVELFKDTVRVRCSAN